MKQRPTKRIALLSAATVVATGLMATGAPPASAAPGDVVINELMYHAVSDLDGDDFLELHNRGTTPVDLSGWTFSGITLTLPAGTTIPSGGHLVVAKDAAQFQATYGFAPAAVYGGNLANSGETVALRDAGGATIDSVSFLDVDPWPIRADGTGPSLELIDASQDNNDFVAWAAATNAAGHTAGAPNSVRRTGLGPRITAVAASSDSPAPNQPLTVTATITGQTSAVVRYRVNFGAEQTIPMTSTGSDGFSATIPGSAAGTLIRYRVEATNASGTNRSPRADDTVNFRGVVVQDGITSAIPVFRWFIADADYNAIIGQPTQDIIRPAVLAYGTTVYDNVLVNIRGQGSETSVKPNWKFEMPQGHDFDMPGLLVEPVNEFAMQADASDVAHGRSMLSFDAYRRAGVVNTQVFPVRTQRNGAFQGIYNYLDLYDGTWREREGYDDHQFFKANINAFDPTVPLANRRFEKKTPDDGDYAPLQSFLDGIALTGAAERNYLLANADLPQLINYAAVTAIIQHVDSSTKNFYLTQDPDTARWSMLPWDLDHTFGNKCCFTPSTFVTPAEPGDRNNPVMAALFASQDFRDMYFRRLRTLVDDLLATNRMEALYDAVVGVAQPEIALDFARWAYDENESYTQQRTLLFRSIASRRTVFAGDARVPGSQPASPAIVINEIQHSPAAGDGAEFVELHNPTGQAIDLSSWTIGGAIDLEIQPGTVILPQQTLTFVSDDPAFREAHGSTVFVGDRYDGNLGATGTLTLVRADGTTADSVDYGGAGWPVPTSGQSLELTDPASDNNSGSSWALSTGAGTPGRANGGVVVTVPGTPAIGTATAANASATVTWTAPGSNGGAAIAGYQVRVVNSAGAQVGALRPATASATSLVVTGLTNGTAYRFQVAATNSVGTGNYSALSNAVTPAATATVPGPPVIGAPSQGAVGGALTAVARWTPPTTNGGSAITGYQVIALRMSSTAPDATVLSRTTSRVLGPAVRQRELTLPAGTYRFEVVAINGIGTSPPSARSAVVVPR
jgi:CotH kinase protein/Lamin Tail Domain/Fibronectin type III domain